MANTTKDLKTYSSSANYFQPQQEAKNKAGQVYYIGQAVVKDANGRADNPGGGNAALYVVGVFREYPNWLTATEQAASANDDTDFTLDTGEFLHFTNSAVNPLVAGDIGKGCFFEDNQTVGRSAAAGSPGAVFLGFETAPDGTTRIKVGVGPQYWGAVNAAA